MMPWIALVFALEVGIIPIGWAPFSQSLDITTSIYAGADLEVQVFDNHAFIRAEPEIMAWVKEGYIEFIPGTPTLDITFGYRIGAIEIGYSHVGARPSISGGPVSAEDIRYEGSYEKIYIRVKGQAP